MLASVYFAPVSPGGAGERRPRQVPSAKNAVIVIAKASAMTEASSFPIQISTALIDAV